MDRSNHDTHPHSLAARQRRLEQAHAIGIDDAMIATLVESFYTRIRDHAVLGPIFNERIHDWPVHLGQMNRFWQSILLSAGNFTGNPMMKHLAIPNLDEDHFRQWLELFYQTLNDVAPNTDAVAHIGGKARMIAESLLTGIWMHKKGDPLKRANLPQI